MQFREFLSLLQKRGLSYASYEISFSSPKTWTIICNLRIFFLLSKNVVCHMQFLEFLSLLQKHGLLYTISKISFSSPKMLTIICNFCNFFPFSKNVDYQM